MVPLLSVFCLSLLGYVEFVGSKLNIFMVVCLTEKSPYFSIKLYHSGSLNETRIEYVGAVVSYFDTCTEKDMNMFGIEAMLSKLGLEIRTCYWYMLVPGSTLPDGLRALSVDEDVGMMVDSLIYSRLQVVYFIPGLLHMGIM